MISLLTLNFQRCNFADTVHPPTATLHTIQNEKSEISIKHPFKDSAHNTQVIAGIIWLSVSQSAMKWNNLLDKFQRHRIKCILAASAFTCI